MMADGKGGRPPKPTSLKVLHGNPGKRKINRNEPQPVVSDDTPKPPRYLGRYAKTEWRRVVPELHRLGLLSVVDRAALEAYCEAYHDWREAKLALDEEGRTYKTDTGYIRPRPEIKFAAEAVKTMKAFMGEFGLTPSARSRIAMPESEEVDPFEDFLRGTGS